jgi:hypothetical protein
LNKITVATFLLIPIYTFLYLLIAIFPMLTFFVQSLTPFFYLSVYIFFVFYVMFMATFVFDAKLKIKLENSDWLKLNLIFLVIEIGVALTLIVFTVISLGIIGIEQKVGVWYFVWFMAFILGIFPYFNKIRNTLGMKFGKIYGASLQGASVYADLSALKFRNEEKKGFTYLFASLRMLRDYLKIGNRRLRLLDKTISKVNTIRLYAKDVPYQELTLLAEGLGQLPEMDKIAVALEEFHNAENCKWSSDFLKIKKKQWWNIERFGEKLIIPIALLIVTVIGVFPEQLRTQVIDWITRIDWLGIVGFLILGIIAYGILNFVERVKNIDITYKDFKEYLAISANKKTNTTNS